MAIARLFIIDGEQVVLKSIAHTSETNIAQDEILLADSLLRDVISSGTLLAIENLHANPYFTSSSQVTELNSIAYLAIPIRISSGQLVAYLDVIDHKPHAWTEAEISIVQELISILVDEIELHLKLEQSDTIVLHRPEHVPLSAEYFRDVQELSPDGFMAFESVRDAHGAIIDFRWLYANPAVHGFVGRSHSELLGKYLLEEMPGNRTEGLFDAYVRVVESGESWQKEFPYYHDNIARWFLTKAIRTGDGFAVTFTNITQAKEDELHHRLNLQRLRLALQTAQMDTWNWDIDANEFVLSNYAAQLFHLTAHTKYGIEAILAPVYSKDKEHVAATFIAAHTSNYDIDIEFRIEIHPLLTWVALRGTKYINEQGHTHIIGIVRDVTERRQFEERQQFQIDAGNVFAASLDYQTTIDRILSLIVPRIADWCCIHTLDEHGKVVLAGALHVNPTLTEKLISLRSIQLEGEGDCDIKQVLNTSRSLFYPVLNPLMINLIACDKTREAESNEIGCHSLICTPLISHGEVIGVLSVAMGHSERQYIDQDWRMVDTLAHNMAVALENARLYSDTREAVRVREAFLSIAAHELRNPLTALLGQAQLMQRRLLRDTDTATQEQRTVAIIVDQANRLNKLIASLLDISRLERGEEHFDAYEIEMCSFTKRIISELQETYEKHSLLYSGNQGPLFISGDTVRIEQVIQNLITNAVKYSPKGGNVFISIQHNQDFLELCVRDTGIGIPQSALPNLFRQFFRASNASSYASGLGIGLYIVREIVTRHGGRITVESVEKQGSTFRVFLPLLKPQPVWDDI